LDSTSPKSSRGDIEWKAPWGAIGYAPLLVLRQYRSRQFIPTTHGLAQCEFPYKGKNYKKIVKEISTAWNQISRMKKLTVKLRTTHEYSKWISRRINDNIQMPSKGIEIDSDKVKAIQKLSPPLLKEKFEIS